MSRFAYLLMAIVAVISVNRPASACTAAVISGKVTPDGRPLLWKNRDCGFPQNSVKFFQGGKYSFIGIVNSGVKDPDEVWIGTNSAGFSIMNTQSYNLEEVGPGEERGAANGRIMCMALEICATVDDFRHFLDTLSKPSMIEANIGVIDADGGAVMFEVGYYGYVEYDANDPAVAPHGYVARSNYSFSGGVNTGSGQVRYMAEDQLLMPAAGMGVITPQWILGEVARSFRHPLLGIDLRSGDFNRPHTTGWFLDYDFIPRRTTSSSVVVQGVMPGENPETGLSPLCVMSQNLASEVFSYDQGNGSEKYMYWEALYNLDGDGYMQQLAPVEDAVFEASRPILDSWRAAGRVDSGELKDLYSGLDSLIREACGRYLPDNE